MRSRAVDPTFLSLALALPFLSFVLTPWTRHQSGIPWEWTWEMILIPVTFSVVMLRPRRWLGWLALAIMLAADLRGWPWSSHGWVGGISYLKWKLDAAAAGICPSLGLLLFLLELIIVASIAVKAANPEISWSLAAARVFVSLMAALALWEPLDYFGVSPLNITSSLRPVVRTIVAVLPAIVFCSLVWRKQRGVVLWVCVIVASGALGAVAIFESERVTMVDIALLSLAMMAGPVWVYFDWQRSRAIGGGRGFDVLMSVRTVDPPVA